MRISWLFGAAVALSVLTPIAPSRAATISPGDLMYTDFYLWNGQAGYIDGRTGGPALTWREILANFDCTEELNFYLWNVPTPTAPVIIPPVINPGVEPVDPVDPVVDPPGGGGGGGATAVPEPSTWAMLLLGLAGLGYTGFRRRRGPISAFD